MEYVEALHSITNPTRYQILHLLMERHYCVQAISKKLGISEPAVSQQMNILKKAGVITGKKIGYHMHYDVNIEFMKQISEQFMQELIFPRTPENLTAECICEYECERKQKQSSMLGVSDGQRISN